MQKSIWIFGIIAGAFCATLEFLYYKTENFSAMTMYISKMAVLAISIVLGLILVRKLLGGTISIGRTLLSGVLISLIRAAVMIGAFTYFFQPNGDFYAPKLQEAFVQAEKKIEADENIKKEDKPNELELAKQQIAGQFTPRGYATLAIGGSVITGFIISILTAVFISKNMMYE
ncbi:MAG: hypothetical protein RLZZ337_877 [Bacteroidota bacterium]|jgi:hypothetical protein